MGGPANVTLGIGTRVMDNIAFSTGGGVFNADGATLTLSGGSVTFNDPNDIVNNPSSRTETTWRGVLRSRIASSRLFRAGAVVARDGRASSAATSRS